MAKQGDPSPLQTFATEVLMILEDRNRKMLDA